MFNVSIDIYSMFRFLVSLKQKVKDLHVNLLSIRVYFTTLLKKTLYKHTSAFIESYLWDAFNNR